MLDGRYAIALDELLYNPDHRQLRDALLDATPVAYRDQQAAATSETTGLTAALAKHLVATVEERNALDVPDWIRLSALHTWARYNAGDLDTCRHNPNPVSPQPVFAAPWKPDLIVCAQCLHLLPPPRGSVADQTCDRCGLLCAGKPDDPIYPCGVQVGPMVWQFALCGGCRADTTQPV